MPPFERKKQFAVFKALSYVIQVLGRNEFIP